MSERPDLNRLWSTVASPKPREQAHRNGYVPFLLRDRAERLQVVPVSEPSRFPAYSSLSTSSLTTTINRPSRSFTASCW